MTLVKEGSLGQLTLNGGISRGFWKIEQALVVIIMMGSILNIWEDFINEAAFNIPDQLIEGKLIEEFIWLIDAREDEVQFLDCGGFKLQLNSIVDIFIECHNLLFVLQLCVDVFRNRSMELLSYQFVQHVFRHVLP